MSEQTPLRVAGERAGILPEYVNFDGSKRVITPDATYEAILRSLGDPERRGAKSSGPVADSPPPTTSVRCLSCREISSKKQLRGVWANLYSIRSKTNGGVGDFGDLRRLVSWAAALGLDFIAINPLHALRNRGHDVSPYRPISRLYRNEMYLDLEIIPELNDCPEAQTLMKQPEYLAERKRLQEVASVEYEAVWAQKRQVLAQLHRPFQVHQLSGGTQRGQEYKEFLKREGGALRDFATFMVLDELQVSNSTEWLRWVHELVDPRAAVIEAFRNAHRESVDFHCYIQFELDRQLESIARLAKESGMAVGLMGDLAIGSSPDGGDPWAFPELFLKGVSIGAPPDDLGPSGQNWSLPPMNPHTLAETDFAYWRMLLRNNMAHVGALRIDHVMGLLRQFWIPDGFDGSMGAYMQFPAERLFSILAEESRKNHCIIVGEDLGTVPDGFRDLLRKFGVLSTCVVRFEKEWGGAFKPAAAYPEEVYVVVETHDMSPLAGFVRGRELAIRGELEHWGAAQIQDALKLRQNEWNAVLARLKAEGFQVDNSKELCVVGSLNEFLAKLPSCMVAASLDDLAEEIEPVNIPGFGQDRHRSWSRRMTKSLESILESKSVKQSLTSWKRS